MIRRLQRGQVVMMFAVMVPIFVIFLAFIIDIGQLYYEKSNTKRAADSVIRTVEKVIGDGASGERIAESEIPSSVDTYSTYADLIADYPDAATELEQLENDINVLKATLDGIEIEQKFMVDGEGNFYYRVEVSKTYNAVMKIASAADGSSSTESVTVTATMIIKFERDKNIVTGGGLNAEALMNQFLDAEAVTRNEMLNSLLNPKTPEETASNFGTLKEFFALKIAKNETEKVQLKANVIQRMLKSTAFSEQEKGEMCDAYLSSLVTSDQMTTQLKIISLASVSTYYTAEKLKDILVYALRTAETVTNIESTLENNVYIIVYEDLSTAKRYIVKINGSGVITQGNY